MKPNENQIDIYEIFLELLTKKLSILIGTTFFFVFTIIFSLSLENQYTSQALLSPNDQNRDNNVSNSQFARLSGLAGISMPSPSMSKTNLGIAKLKSFSFFKEFADQNDVVIDIFAGYNWDNVTGVAELDNSIFSNAENIWYVNKGRAPYQKAHKKFLRDYLSIQTDDKTGLVTISITHNSPIVAEAWLTSMINLLNNLARNEAIEQAENSINYLTTQASTNNIMEIQAILFELVQEEVSRIALAKANPDFLFKVIDSPVVPDEKSAPSRSFIVILGTILGFIVTISFLLIQNAFSKRSNS